MNSILGYSQILERDAELSPFQRDALATISSSCDHLLHLVNNILDLSKTGKSRTEDTEGTEDLRSEVGGASWPNVRRLAIRGNSLWLLEIERSRTFGW
jgi:signal transduction histidine kinase